MPPEIITRLSRHPLTRKHNTLDTTPKSVPSAAGTDARTSLASVAVGVRTPLDQQSLRSITSSINSNLPSLDSYPGKSPTPSLLTAAKTFDSLTERVSAYKGTFIAHFMDNLKRAKSSLRRDTKANPENLSQNTEELREISQLAKNPDRVKELKKRAETRAALDHLKIQGIFPPPIPSSFYAQSQTGSNLSIASTTGSIVSTTESISRALQSTTLGVNPEAKVSQTSLGKRTADSATFSTPKRVLTGNPTVSSQASNSSAQRTALSRNPSIEFVQLSKLQWEIKNPETQQSATISNSDYQVLQYLRTKVNEFYTGKDLGKATGFKHTTLTALKTLRNALDGIGLESKLVTTKGGNELRFSWEKKAP